MAVAAETVAEATIIEHRRGFRRRWYRTPTLRRRRVDPRPDRAARARSRRSSTWHDPIQQNLLDTLQGPSSTHPLGTDELGRDVWSRLVYGARTDLRVAFLAVLFPFVIGTLIGLVAGYYGGWVDTITNWLVNVVVAFPFYVLIIALVFALGLRDAQHLHRDHDRRLGLVHAHRPRRGARREAARLRPRGASRADSRTRGSSSATCCRT